LLGDFCRFVDEILWSQIHCLIIFMPDSESIIKSSIAKNLIEELLKASGRRVYRLGADFILENITQNEEEFDRDSAAGKKIAAIPDYLVFDTDNMPLFIDVKFRRNPGSLEEELLLEKEIKEKYWETRLILVTTAEKPYFRLLIPPYFSSDQRDGWLLPVARWQALEKVKNFGIDLVQLKRFEQMAEKYYRLTP